MTIRFYRPKEEYGPFSNFSNHSIRLSNKIWPTSEHYFQAMKFLDEDLQEKVRNCRSPGASAKMGRDRSLPLRPDWEEEKDDVMREVIRAKFTQHYDLKKLLLGTETEHIIEDSPVDFYWGCGSDGTGKNMLGRILMEVRDDLLSIHAKTPEIFDYFDAPFKYDDYSSGNIMSGNSGLLMELRIRGWGKLTGKGANGLDEDHAAKIQDEFYEWVETVLNKAWEKRKNG